MGIAAQGGEGAAEKDRQIGEEVRTLPREGASAAMVEVGGRNNAEAARRAAGGER